MPASAHDLRPATPRGIASANAEPYPAPILDLPSPALERGRTTHAYADLGMASQMHELVGLLGASATPALARSGRVAGCRNRTSHSADCHPIAAAEEPAALPVNRSLSTGGGETCPIKLRACQRDRMQKLRPGLIAKLTLGRCRGPSGRGAGQGPLSRAGLAMQRTGPRSVDRQ